MPSARDADPGQHDSDLAILRAYLGASPAAAFLKDPRGRYIYANRAWEQATAKTAAEYIGRTDEDLWPAEAASQMEAADREALESGNAVPAPWPVERSDAWASWRFPVPLATGEVHVGGCALRAGPLWPALDQPIRRLAGSGTIGVVYGEEDLIIEANDVFLEMLGLTRDELPGLTWSSLVLPEFSDVHEETRRELIATGRCRAKRKALRRKDGGRVEVSVGGALLEPAPRNSWVFYVLNMEEQERLNRRAHREQAWESLGLMAAGLAHDFNNLLAVILGNASLARGQPDCAQSARGYLGEVISAAEEAAGLIRRLLAYSGKARLALAPVALQEVVLDVCRVEARSVRLELEIDEDLPAAWADPAQIREVLRALLVNAVEASGPGGRVRIAGTVKTLREELLLADAGLPPGEYVSISVHDSGPGMDARVQARVFDPFFSTKFTGRGLGLAAAYGIVRRHAGAIHVESRPGQGSCFELLLPRPAAPTT